MDDTISDKLSKLIDLLSKKASTSPTETKKQPAVATATASPLSPPATDQPREVIKQGVLVKVDDYSDNAKKFWNDLFKKFFSKKEEEEKKPIKEGSGFWKTLLTILGGVLLAAIELFREKILPYLKKAYEFIKDAFALIKGVFNKVIQGFKDVYALINEGKIGEIFQKIITKIKGIFRGMKLKILKTLRKSKLGRMIIKVYRSIARIFKGIFKSIISVLTRIKTGKIGAALGKMFSAIGRIFKAFIKIVKGTVRVGGTMFGAIGRGVGKLFKAFGSIGKLIARLLPGIKVVAKIVGKLFLPLTILLSAFDIFSGIFTTVQQEGLSFTSVLKGFAVGLIKIFTLGFLDTDEILSGFNKAIDTLGNFFANLWEMITNLPTVALNALRKIPGAKYLLGEDDKLPSELAAGAGKPLTQSEIDAGRKKRDAEMRDKGVAPKSSAPTNKIPAQDFISRPGKADMPFSSKDTVIGMKDGGPFDVFTRESLDVQKKSLVQGTAMIEQLKAIGVLLTTLNKTTADSRKGSTTVVNAPTTTQLTFGQPTPTAAFRQQLSY